MPDLASTLSELFSGGDMTIFQATVDAVGTGVLTVHVNGGSFTDVPFMDSYADPVIGDACYVIGRKDWGMLVLGRPAPGPERAGPDSQVVEWEPFTRSRANNFGGWTAPPLDEMLINPGDAEGSAAVYFFDTGDVAWPGEALSTASFYLEVSDVQTGSPVENAYVEIGLHSTAVPGSGYTEMVNLNAVYKISATDDTSRFVSIPLDWAGRLLVGEAKGIYVRSIDYPMTISGPGTLRLTSL